MKGKRRKKNVGLLWDEPKEMLCVSLTKEGKALLRDKANRLELSISEMIELLARGSLDQPECGNSEIQYFGIIGKLKAKLRI
jgi:hypothetical protein